MKKEDKIGWWAIITCFIGGMSFISFLYSRTIEAIGFALATLLSFLVLKIIEDNR